MRLGLVAILLAMTLVVAPVSGRPGGFSGGSRSSSSSSSSSSRSYSSSSRAGSYSGGGSRSSSPSTTTRSSRPGSYSGGGRQAAPVYRRPSGSTTPWTRTPSYPSGSNRRLNSPSSTYHREHSTSWNFHVGMGHPWYMPWTWWSPAPVIIQQRPLVYADGYADGAVDQPAVVQEGFGFLRFMMWLMIVSLSVVFFVWLFRN